MFGKPLKLLVRAIQTTGYASLLISPTICWMLWWLMSWDVAHGKYAAHPTVNGMSVIKWLSVALASTHAHINKYRIHPIDIFVIAQQCCSILPAVCSLIERPTSQTLVMNVSGVTQSGYAILFWDGHDDAYTTNSISIRLIIDWQENGLCAVRRGRLTVLDKWPRYRTAE